MFREINNLRKSWNLGEAYNLAIQEYNKNPNDKFIKWAYSWILYDYLKKSKNINDFENYFTEFLTLNIDFSWEVDIKWLIWSILYNFLKQEKNINNYKKLLFYYSKLNLEINSETHKFIFIDILKREKDENFKKVFNFIEFIKLVPFEIFKRTNFHEEYKTEDWIKIPTLFEKIITIIWEKIKNSKDINNLWDIYFLEKILKYWIEKNWKWSGYYLWKLFLIKWDYHLSLKYIKEVVKKEKTQFWSWYSLGDILLKLWKDDLYFSSLSKALSVWKDDNFLNNLRLEYLSDLEKRWFEEEANIELNKIIENKIKNWYKIDEELLKLKNKKWFKENTNWSNYNFYKKFIKDIEIFLYDDIQDNYIIVDWIDKKTNRIYFISQYEEKSFIIYKGILNIEINDILKVKMEKINWKYIAYKVEKYSWEINNLQKAFSWNLKIKDWNIFGFIDNIFIEWKYLNWLNNWDSFSGIAIKTYDKKKNKFWWKCINVTSCT